MRDVRGGDDRSRGGISTRRQPRAAGSAIAPIETVDTSGLADTSNGWSRKERSQAEIQDRAAGNLEMRLAGVVAIFCGPDDHFTGCHRYPVITAAITQRGALRAWRS